MSQQQSPHISPIVTTPTPTSIVTKQTTATSKSDNKLLFHDRATQRTIQLGDSERHEDNRIDIADTSAPTSNQTLGDQFPSSSSKPYHNNQIIHERNEPSSINDLASVNIINPAQVTTNKKVTTTATNSWRFTAAGADQSSPGEENALPVSQSLSSSSLDKIIIGSGVVITTAGTQERNAAAAESRSLNTKQQQQDSSAALVDTTPPSLIQISDKALHSSSSVSQQSERSIAQLAQTLSPQHSEVASTTTTAASSNSALDSKRLRYKSLLDAASPGAAAAVTPTATPCDSSSAELLNSLGSSSADRISHRDTTISGYEQVAIATPAGRNREEIQLETLHEEDTQEEEGDDEDYQDDDDDKSSDDEQTVNGDQQIGQFESYTKFNGRKFSTSFRKSTNRLLGGHAFIRIQRLLGVFNSKLLGSDYKPQHTSNSTPYVPYESKDLLTGDSKYPSTGSGGKARLSRKLRSASGKTFRGGYKYSRAEISMAICKKLINLLVQRSTLALFGAFLIHVTLGTVYTLSNINSYLTSYMRLHGSPTLTYGASMWLSSSYAVGQGFSMVLGGYLEKRFSARLSCFLGCLIHSGSIMGTSWAINHGALAVLMSYGFLPGFGCGLAYMTPMSNGFGWFPNRRGLVAGVILAGFGIGTFVFNIAQTAFVNPANLSPPLEASGYFTQESILTKVPGLFLFIGSIYAAMQFVGCCLLFKPPQDHLTNGVYGIITQGVLFVNSMIKEYGQLFIGDDMYLAWTGSMASIANALGRLVWGLAIDRYTFTQCFTCITTIFGLLMFLMPFEFILSSKHLYLLCTLGIFGSFSGWMSTFPVHLSRTFGRLNAGMLYGLIFISQSFGGIATAFGAHYLIDHYTRFVPFFCVVFLEILGLAIYHLFYPKQRYL